MSNPENNPDCPRCKGEGFYLAHEGRGYYHDGSFGHNVWEDCHCSFIDQVKTKDEESVQ
jgi:hypothetical protein